RSRRCVMRGAMCFFTALIWSPLSSFSLLVFPYPPLDPRVLPSFPTRRSSDLPAARGCRNPRRPSAPPPGVRKRRTAGRQAGGRTDRKSTRLNSSHGSISYAVFCLKKKKQETSSVTTTGSHRTRVEAGRLGQVV